MKINLLLQGDEILSNYLNIDPFATGEDNKQKGDIHNLDSFVDDGEAVEIRAIDILEYFPAYESEKIVNNWLKKLRHGGKIIISSTDLTEVAKGVSNYRLDIDQANLLLHGEQKEPWQFKKANFTVLQLSEFLASKGLKILKKRVVNYRCVVEAERP